MGLVPSNRGSKEMSGYKKSVTGKRTLRQACWHAGISLYKDLAVVYKPPSMQYFVTAAKTDI